MLFQFANIMEYCIKRTRSRDRNEIQRPGIWITPEKQVNLKGPTSTQDVNSGQTFRKS